MDDKMDEPFLDTYGNPDTTHHKINDTLDTSIEDSLNSSNTSKHIKTGLNNSSNRSTNISE
jgi:hypothetical protein